MSYGCATKYNSFSDDTTKLECPKVEIARIWESNVNMLVEDQKDMYGCINQECCTQVNTIITGKFSILSVCNLLTALYLFLFIVNQQYMVKTISRYQIRHLNHNGDYLNFMLVLFFTCLFFVFKF